MAFPAGSEDGECVSGAQRASGVVAAVVTLTYNRPNFLRRHLDSVVSTHGQHAINRCK